MGLYQNIKALYIKGNIKKTIMQSMRWEKIFANHLSDKGILSKIRRNSYNSTTTTTTTNPNNPIKKRTRAWIDSVPNAQLVYEKMLHFINNPRNVNQDHNEMWLHTW